MFYRDYLEPFYRTGRMFRESVLFWKENGESWAELRFKPKKIIECLTSDERTEFLEGKDFRVEGRKIIALSGKIPAISPEEYRGEKADEQQREDMRRYGIKGPLYSESFFIDRQVVFSYEYATERENIKTEDLRAGKLHETEKKLRQGKIKAVLYGDSISVGCTSSGYMNKPPFLPNWFTLFTGALQELYGTVIAAINASESGMTSEWGVNYMKDRLPQDADLYIFAWGMNDGTSRISPERYEENIRKMILYTDRKTTEYILISPMIPNPDAELTDGKKFLGEQEEYIDRLYNFFSPRIAISNMTDFHKRLLVSKKYCDLTGNNINHPNDFLSRMYAVNLLEIFEKFKGEYI